jgi:antibiotic biosynthesis monooxygenase (ABM) superfamily enzyme
VLAFIVTVCVALLPTLTDPKLTELGLTARELAVPVTLTYLVALYVVPVLSLACITIVCAPLATLKEVLSVLAFTE